uniref:Uncharacterized protein n=2 Tax=Anguilla anguilla TaxID=7936 RepID=A0A0E9QPX9_ANGAN
MQGAQANKARRPKLCMALYSNIQVRKIPRSYRLVFSIKKPYQSLPVRISEKLLSNWQKLVIVLKSPKTEAACGILNHITCSNKQLYSPNM